LTEWNERIHLGVDPLACSWYLHRTNTLNTMRSVKKSALTREDFEQAKKVREHFAGKLVLLQLGGKHITPYRKELLKILSEENSISYMHEHAGMLMSLPRLYLEDMFLTELKENYDNTSWRMTEVHNEKVERTLTYIGNHPKKSFSYGLRRTANDMFTCNWFHDNNDRLYLIETDNDCPYRMFFTKLINKPFRIIGKPIKHHSRDDLRYYQLHDWYFIPNTN